MLIRAVLCFLMFSLTFTAKGNELKVVWICGAHEVEERRGPFWEYTRRFMVAAAQDLGIELQIYYANEDFTKMAPLVKQALSDINRTPDALLFHDFKRTGAQSLRIAEEHQIPTLIFNSSIRNQIVGKPRKDLKYWVGELLPDDVSGAKNLMAELTTVGARMKKNLNRDELQVIAIAGNRASGSSLDRLLGLGDAVANTPNLSLVETMYAEWQIERAKQITQASIRLSDAISIFWTSSDSMGQGVVEGATEAGWIAGEDYITGGFDLTAQGVKYVKEGKFVATIGGHYVDGAWAMVLLHDYLKGMDFASSGNPTLMTEMAVVNKDNVSQFEDITQLLSEQNIKDKINFRNFSLIHNPKLKEHHFDSAEVFEMLH